MKFKDKCIEKLVGKAIVCEEKKRKIIFYNPNRWEFLKIKVDDCQIKEGIRCDCLVIYKDVENFIELKGSDIRHAVKQIEQSIKILGSKNCNTRKSFIVSSRNPLSSTEIQGYQIRFKRKYKSDLIIKNNIIEVRTL